MNPDNFKLVWCVNCEEYVYVLDSPSSGLGHAIEVRYETGWEIDWCDGFFTSDAPPMIDPDWELTLVEPDNEFMTISNESAELLLAEFIS